MKLEQIKKNIKYGDYNILQKLLKTSSVSVAKRKFLSGDKEALDAMMVIQENRTIFPYLHDELYEFDGLVQALKNKADLNHRHDISDINNLSAVLDKVEYLYIDSERKVNVDGSNAIGNLKEAVDNRHSHSNKTVLDNLTQKVIDDSHTHTNKTLLDTYNQTNANISDAVSLKHTHTNKNVLDGVSAAKVSNWDAASVNTHTHANKTVLDNVTQSVIDNNHSHTNKALLDSYNQTNANVTDAVNLKHNHSNKVVLDAITEAFKTADKKLLDALGGLQFESDQANAILRIKDGNGALLTSISLAYLNNEGTKFTYNTIGKMLELRNDADNLLSSIPVSSFVTNLVSDANWNGTTPMRLDFKDNAGVVLFSVDYSMTNIQGLVSALAGKADTSGSYPNITSGNTLAVRGVGANWSNTSNIEQVVVLDNNVMKYADRTYFSSWLGFNNKADKDGGNITNVAQWETTLGIDDKVSKTGDRISGHLRFVDDTASVYGNGDRFGVKYDPFYNGLNFARLGFKDGVLFLKDNNNVGVGTTNPQAKLDVNGDIKTFSHNGSLEWNQAYNERVIQFDTSYTTNVYVFSLLLSDGTIKSTNLQTSTAHFTINSSGVLHLNSVLYDKINDSATQTYVDNKMASIAIPNNGAFTVQGVGDLVGAGATTANASTNSVASLDLSNNTKNRIQRGVNAYNSTITINGNTQLIGNNPVFNISGGAMSEYVDFLGFQQTNTIATLFSDNSIIKVDSDYLAVLSLDPQAHHPIIKICNINSQERFLIVDSIAGIPFIDFADNKSNVIPNIDIEEGTYACLEFMHNIGIFIVTDRGSLNFHGTSTHEVVPIPASNQHYQIEDSKYAIRRITFDTQFSNNFYLPQGINGQTLILDFANETLMSATHTLHGNMILGNDVSSGVFGVLPSANYGDSLLILTYSDHYKAWVFNNDIRPW